MPEGARIFHIDSDRFYINHIAHFLKLAGHCLVIRASKSEEFDKLIKSPTGLNYIDVAIVGGRILNENGILRYNGGQIAREIKKRNPYIKVIGNADLVPILSAHVNCIKQEGFGKLVKVVLEI